jgi:Na+-translocating ferredoxin:NAD+ oxidoreductase RnfE subunit
MTYTPHYPDELPDIAIEPYDTVNEAALTAAEHNDLLTAVMDMANESIGMVMAFTLCTTAKEMLDKTLVFRRDEKLRLEQERKDLEEQACHSCTA